MPPQAPLLDHRGRRVLLTFASRAQKQKGTKPQRIRKISRSPLSRFSRITGWKVSGATFQDGPKVRQGRAMHPEVFCDA
jgi:hypothetical protein